jgi:hypothetical protein
MSHLLSGGGSGRVGSALALALGAALGADSGAADALAEAGADAEAEADAEADAAPAAFLGFFAFDSACASARGVAAKARRMVAATSGRVIMGSRGGKMGRMTARSAETGTALEPVDG